MKKVWLITLISIVLGTMSCCKKVVYTVTFETSGGSPVPEVQHVKAGGKATAPTINPAMENRIFWYWYLPYGAYDFQTPINRDITLRAMWLEYDNRGFPGGSRSASNPTW